MDYSIYRMDYSTHKKRPAVLAGLFLEAINGYLVKNGKSLFSICSFSMIDFIFFMTSGY